MTYSNEASLSTIMMYKHSSSIKSSFVGLTYGESTDDCDRPSSSDDDEFDILVFLGGTIQNLTIRGINVSFLNFEFSISHGVIVHFRVN